VSGKIKLNFGVDEKPPLGETLLYGMQWLAIGLPMVVVLGQVVASHNFSNATDQVVFMQKLFFVTAVSSLLQLFFGHRLPAVIGPAAILVVGITSSQGVGLSSIYTSIMIGGALLTLLCLTGLFSKIEKLFTRQIIAVILLLIALTLVPTILNLISSVPAAGMEFFHFVFALVFIVAMFMANRFLKGMWKSTMIIWAMIAGSIVYVLLVPEYNWMSGESLSVFSNFFSDLSFSFSLDIGVLISFIICFVALSTNDLGSIQAIGELVNAPDMGKRLSAGINVTGLSSVIAGFLGVPGPVNYSLSTGVIASTGIGSRFTLVPAGFILLFISFMPGVVSFLSGIPPLIIGVVFLYVMCSQIAAGLLTAFSGDSFSFEDGLIIALSLMLGLIVSFLPDTTVAALPHLLRPILGNGFVVGTAAVLLMEHVVYRKRASA